MGNAPKKNMGVLINLEHLSLISGQVMPSNVIEYCTPHDRLTKELVIPGKLIQRRHNMGHNVHSRASYIFLDKPTRNRALAFKSIADYYFMYSYSAKILNSSIIFYLYFFQTIPVTALSQA